MFETIMEKIIVNLLKINITNPNFTIPFEKISAASNHLQNLIVLVKKKTKQTIKFPKKCKAFY